VKRHLSRATNVEDIRRLARRRVPRVISDFVEGGAEDEVTVRRNEDAFDELALVPKAMVGVAERDLTTTVVGEQLSLPVILGPAGLARIAHQQGEEAVARAAGIQGTVFTLSTGSSASIEAVAAAAAGPLWFQLYLWRDRDVIASLIRRAANSGYRALCVTVDVPIIGQRERDIRNGMTIPLRLRPGGILDAGRRMSWLYGLARGPAVTFANFTDIVGIRGGSASSLADFVNREMMNPGADWSDLEWVREQWHGPLIVKGIMSAEDAKKAVDLGAQGVVVSNHGGRQLDQAPASLHALEHVVQSVGEHADVMLDGGIRRGTDVLKAVALGARAVMIARPWFYGLGAGGEDGVIRVLEILRSEIDRGLALVGSPSISKLDPSFVRRAR
jgi:isopentenyl diphosphate isomerase/L-lactate dehydrogenase-like FMN-dependent dehydrogenase